MRRIAVIAIAVGMTTLGSAAVAGDVDGGAVIGGAVGGGLGAAAGSYFGGRTGAILGSAVGAATGTAIATHEDEDRHVHHVEPTHREVVYVTPAGSHGKKKKNKGCPPGLQMQERC